MGGSPSFPFPFTPFPICATRSCPSLSAGSPFSEGGSASGHLKSTRAPSCLWHPPGRTTFAPPFAGKRLCLGEGLARMELFLFLTTILQAFTLTSPVSLGEVNIVPDASGVSRVPMRYQLFMVPRRA